MSAARILFAGTPEFALVSLRALCDAGHTPHAVLTQPDRPAGRGKRLGSSPVKQFAEANGIDVWQPPGLKDPGVVAQIAKARPDVIIVTAYGLILPQSILDIPPAGCLNVHASLLPRWRGASPIQATILHGDKLAGVSLMRMEAGLDSGPVYVQSALPVGDSESAGELHDRLALLGGAMLVENLADIVSGGMPAVAQDDALATYAHKISKHDCRIIWTASADEIVRKIRAYNPVPGAVLDHDGEPVKCFRAAAVAAEPAPAGTVLAADKRGVMVACGSGALRLDEVQRPGRRRVSGAEFAAQGDLVGQRFGWLS